MREGLQTTLRPPVCPPYLALRARQEERADGGLTGAALRRGARLGGLGALRVAIIASSLAKIDSAQIRPETGHIKFE
jgi:hypothetical protein